MEEGPNLQAPATHQDEYKKRVAKFFDYIAGQTQAQPTTDQEPKEDPGIAQ